MASMNQILDALRELLDIFDRETKRISEREVSKAISSARDPKDLSEPPMQWLAEAMAFDFHENYHDQRTGWGTYYGPMFVCDNGDGTITEWPSLKKLTPQIIQYWSDRAKAAKHPVLRARYADLVWDLQKVITGESPDYSMAQIVIDSSVEIAHRHCHAHEVHVIEKLGRALSLAIILNDDRRTRKTADAIIAYEDAVTDDSRLGLWGFAYDLLFENDKVQLTAAQRQKLIGDLEGHLQRASERANKDEIDPWEVDAAALRLARFYRKAGRGEDTKRVIVAIGDAFTQASATASALQTSAWLQRVHATFKQFGLSDEAEKISVKLREIGAKARSELKPISHTVKLPKETIEKHIAALTEGSLDQALSRTAEYYVPRKSEVTEQMKELASEAPILFTIPMELQDDTGRPVAKVGSLEEDLPGQIVKQMSQNMAIDSVLLRQVLDSLVKKHPDFQTGCTDHILRSPVFKEARRPIIEQGIKHYLKGEQIAAAHLFIPQIEDALRVLLEKAGGSVLKQARGGGFHYKVLEDLLHEQLLGQVLGEDILAYFRVLLVDQRGWNLRNCICHGLCDASDFGSRMSDRIFHVLLCLAGVRETS